MADGHLIASANDIGQDIPANGLRNADLFDIFGSGNVAERRVDGILHLCSGLEGAQCAIDLGGGGEDSAILSVKLRRGGAIPKEAKVQIRQIDRARSGLHNLELYAE